MNVVLVRSSCTPTWHQRHATTSSVCVLSALCFFLFLFCFVFFFSFSPRALAALAAYRQNSPGRPTDIDVTTHTHVQLARDGYYANIKFHRLIPGFMVRCAFFPFSRLSNVLPKRRNG